MTVEQEKAAAEYIIVCRDVHKWYGEFHVLKGITTSVKQGEKVVILGPSGSGKSTFIRTINRLEEHQKGQIIVDNVEMTSDVRNIDFIRRDVGMVFQSFNLFPHLTVMENITLAPLKVRKWPRDQAEEVAIRTSGAGRESPSRLKSIPPDFQAASSSGSPLPERLRCNPESCSSMNPPRLWTPK